ncbi:MAG TPA: TraB/GumN family protein [Burkholderiales bacterium]|nr:TraB/GumN family protein [Burkholderiales bacterium]
MTFAAHRILFALLLSLFALSSAIAQTTAYTQGLLWKVEGRGREPSYVFGTIHISDPRVTALPAPVRSAFDAARSFAVEVTLDPATMLQAAHRTIYTDGRDLRTVIGAPLFEKVAAGSGTLGLPPELLKGFKPWAIGLFLSTPDVDPTNVLDFVLQRNAMEQKKALHSLETIDEQLDVFDKLSERDQVAFLRAALEARERLPALVQRMTTAYLARDLAALTRISEEERGDAETRRMTTALMQRLLYDRNVLMAKRAETLFAGGNVFVAVGALHLYGDRGVLAELARRGLRVSRVY